MGAGMAIDGPVGSASMVPADVLARSLSGDEMATLGYWWIKVDDVAVMVAHAGAEPADIQAVLSLEVLIPGDPRDRLDTYALGLITLSDLPGVAPAKKTWPWVTHELIVFTVDTTRGPVAVTDPLPWPVMSPHNVSVQFQVHDDLQALEVADLVVRAICHGQLLPEIQAYVPERSKMMTLAPLFDLWQECVSTTAEHVRTGGTHEEH